jgi:hypothetical protein
MTAGQKIAPVVGTPAGLSSGDQYLPSALVHGDDQALSRFLGLTIAEGKSMCRCCVKQQTEVGKLVCTACTTVRLGCLPILIVSSL